jgi:hypothetical protein
VSEQFDHLNDEDIEAIDQIWEGSFDQKHGEGILSAIDGADKRREDADRALLDALSRAQSGGDDAA